MRRILSRIRDLIWMFVLGAIALTMLVGHCSQYDALTWVVTGLFLTVLGLWVWKRVLERRQE